MTIYLDDHFKLGRYLGLSVDIGPAMTAKIKKQTRQVVHRSKYQPLTQDEWIGKSAKPNQVCS